MTRVAWSVVGQSGSFLELAVPFLVLAVVAGIIGASGVAGLSIQIAKWFVVLAVVSYLL